MRIPTGPFNGPGAANTRSKRSTNGQTQAIILGEVAPKLPHERDESSSSQRAHPDPVIRQAKSDLERGMVDTDRGEPMNDLYQREFHPPVTPKRRKTRRG